MGQVPGATPTAIRAAQVQVTDPLASLVEGCVRRGLSA